MVLNRQFLTFLTVASIFVLGGNTCESKDSDKVSLGENEINENIDKDNFIKKLKLENQELKKKVKELDLKLKTNFIDKTENKNIVASPNAINLDNKIISKEIYKELSTEKREIKISIFGNDDKNKIAFIGGIHGNEPQGVYIVNKLIEYVNKTPNILKSKRILFIPSANPDSVIKSKRVNANGVDINRNFPAKNWQKSIKKDSYYSGNSPASEVETRILMNYLAKFNPKIIINIHSPYKVVNYDGPSLDLANFISKYNKYPVKGDIGYPTPGSFGSYYGFDKKIKVITLETSENKPNLEWEKNKKALIAVIENLDKL